MRKNVTDDVFFEIAEHLGVLRESPSGWAKELNRIAWNGGQIKFDIREWDPDHDRMARGITLTDEEMHNLYQYFCHWKKSDHSLDKFSKKSPMQRVGGAIYVDIYRTICRLSKENEGWSRDLKVVSWNGQDVKYDIRRWSPDNERMTRGLTFTEEEMQNICDLYWEHEKDRLAKEIFDEAV